MNVDSLDAEHLAQMNFAVGSSRLREDFVMLDGHW
jgi:hypothetical protein